jgi:predicted ArsR family transcriptional regulator
MAIWGEVSYKVKRAITFHERFTVAELVDATDLAYAQVEQVVQRLIKQGYVRSLEAHELNPAEQTAAKQVGRPRQRYTLTDDKAKREEFYASVEAIASAERLSRAKERKPSTPYFNRAMQMIEAMERGAEPFSIARLDEAGVLLAYGRDFEGLITEGAEIVQAYYNYAQARLEAQRGNYSKAEELLTQAKEVFRAAELDEQAQATIDLELALQASQGFAEIKRRIERQADPMPALEGLKRLVCDFPSPSHLLLPLQQAIEALSTALWATMRELQIATRANTIATQQNTQVLQRVAQAIERWGGEAGIGKELVEGAHVIEPYPHERMEPFLTDMDIHISRREERIRIPLAAFIEMMRRER